MVSHLGLGCVLPQRMYQAITVLRLPLVMFSGSDSNLDLLSHCPGSLSEGITVFALHSLSAPGIFTHKEQLDFNPL